MIDKTRPAFVVTLEKTKLASLGAAIEEIEFQEQEDHADSLSITVINVDQSFIDDPKSAVGIIANVQMGYEADLVDFGSFTLDRPEITYTSDGQIQYIFKGGRPFDKSLGSNEERRQFKKKTDAEVAAIIAKEIGLKTEFVDPVSKKKINTITATSKRYNTITVSKKTWMEFLQSRAKHYEFQVWVEKDVLWFGPLKNIATSNQKGDIINLLYSRDGQGDLQEIKVSDDDSGKAASVTSSGVHKATGKAFEFKGDPVPKKDGAQSKTGKKAKTELFTELYTGKTVKKKTASTKEQSAATNKKVTRNSPTKTTADNPSVYVHGEPNSNDPESSKRISESKAQGSAWSIKANFELILGDPNIRKMRKINFQGVGKFSGDYIVTSTSHKLGSSYTVTGEAKTYKSGTTSVAKVKQGKQITPKGKDGSKRTDKSKDVKKPKVVAKYGLYTGKVVKK